MSEMRIIFMGTPDFAVASLAAINGSSHEVVAVVTAPDRPAGRGRQLRESAVKQYASGKGIPVLQPTNLKDLEWLVELRSYEADLFVVVAFRMLPEAVWNMPEKGTINLHASLLPQYRGAAPINWAIINGEKETGVTTFFITHEIDTGKVIDRRSTPINDGETAGDLHDRLMDIGAGLLVETIDRIADGVVEGTAQRDLIEGELKEAPKLNRENCRVDWNADTDKVIHLIHGLSPYPSAWTILTDDHDVEQEMKILRVQRSDRSLEPATIYMEGGQIHVGTANGSLELLELKPAGKRTMSATDFINGSRINEQWKFN